MRTPNVALPLFYLVAVVLTGTLLSAPRAGAETESAAAPAQIPVPGVVTMLDLGAKSCIPCKMMTPVLEQLERDYAGKAAVVFVDVWKNPDQTPRFGIRAIPTQIFYDKAGHEALRHEGFMDRQAAADVLDKLLGE